MNKSMKNMISNASCMGELIYQAYNSLKRLFSAPNSFSVFISKMYAKNSKKYKLMSFSIDFKDIGFDYFCRVETPAFEEHKRRLLSLVSEYELKWDPFGIYSLLFSANSDIHDRYLKDSDSSFSKETAENDGLLPGFSDDTRIYLRPANAARSCYNTSVSNKTLDNDFSALCFFSKKAHTPFPQVKFFDCESQDANTIRIVTVPRLGQIKEYFDFKKAEDGRFFGEYTDDEDKQAQMGILVHQALDKILNEEAPNIIVFSEYSFSPQMLEAAADCLKNRHDHKLSFVIAGTTYMDEEGHKNNVCHLITPYGKCIKAQYKTISYTDKSIRSTSGLSVEKHYAYIVEQLDDPGKIVTMIALQKLGYVQLAICKDYIDKDDFIKNYTYSFEPILIAVPAYSGKLDSFESVAHTQACDSAITTVVVNSCVSNAGIKNKNNGFICVPKREKDVDIGKTVKRFGCKTSSDNDCLCSTCINNCLCYNVLEVKFERGRSKNSVIISKPARKKESL